MMKHYHGIAGMKRDSIVRLAHKRNVLVSYAYPKCLDTAAEICQGFSLDSGAFTIWRKGGKLNVARYVAWCYNWFRHPAFNWAIMPDVIEGDEAENNAMIMDWPKNIAGVPVWHFNESLKKLDWLCDSFPIVALGTAGQKYQSIGSPDWKQRVNEAMAVITDEQMRPRCKIHGLRMLNPSIVQCLPMASADSSSAVRNRNDCKETAYAPHTDYERAIVLADRLEHRNSPAIWVPYQIKEVVKPIQYSLFQQAVN